MEHQLTDKQRRFCEEYLIDLNATQAAIRAGYSKKTAPQQAARLLTNVKVQNYIQELQKDIAERNNISVDECVQILANIARADIGSYFNVDTGLKDLNAIPDEARLAISSVETYEVRTPEGDKIADVRKLKTNDKLRAVDMLMKHLGGYEKDNNQKPTTTNIIHLGNGIKPKK